MVTTHTQPNTNEHTKAAKMVNKEPSGEISRVPCDLHTAWPDWGLQSLRLWKYTTKVACGLWANPTYSCPSNELNEPKL